MKFQYILASHGRFAEGIKESVELILGKQDNIQTICAYVGLTDEISTIIENMISSFSPDDNIIVISDIMTGSVNHEFMHFIKRDNIHLIAGLNLPLLIGLIIGEEVVTKKSEVKSFIINSLSQSKDNIRYCNAIYSDNKKIP